MSNSSPFRRKKLDEDYYYYGEGYDPTFDIDKDNWHAMTDGMYGDYPEERFDGDYEFMGY